MGDITASTSAASTTSTAAIATISIIVAFMLYICWLFHYCVNVVLSMESTTALQCMSMLTCLHA